jgi:hypothetical protein
MCRMLNELHRLSVSLKVAGIRPPRKHPRVKNPGRSSGAAIRVRLAPDGKIVGVEKVTDDEWPGLWHILEGNHNGFPVSNLTKNRDGDGWSKPKSILLLRRLAEKARELADACASHQNLGQVAEVCKRFEKAATNPGHLYDDLVRVLRDNAAQRLAFDADRGTIYSSAVQGAVERMLPKERQARTTIRGRNGQTGHPARACGYSGQAGNLQAGPFPKVMLPVLNKEFPLVSMFSDAACNHRYGLTDSSVVPVSVDLAQELQDALTFIVSPDHEGKTWRGVWNGHFDRSREQQDLLIAYVEGGTIIPSKIASLFGGGSESQAQQFEADASAICDALDAVARDEPASRLSLFVLRRVSDGQAQVQLSSQPSVQEVLGATQSWLEGGRNIPPMLLPMPARKGYGRWFLEQRTPRPDEVVSITSRQWVESGKRWTSSQGANFSQVLTMMLRGPGWRYAATHLLYLTNRRTWPLMLGIFGAILRLRSRDAHRHGYRLDDCSRAMKAVSALGIFLYSLDHRKEEYMHEAPFLVGRLLALADVLHREHSRQERKAAEPPAQLIGNALMPVARDNPMAAVSRLSDRLPFYKAWAERSGDGLARWAVARIRETATELAGITLPSSTDEAEKALLVLGYISKLSDSGSEPEGESEPSGG